MSLINYPFSITKLFQLVNLDSVKNWIRGRGLVLMDLVEGAIAKRICMDPLRIAATAPPFLLWKIRSKVEGNDLLHCGSSRISKIEGLNSYGDLFECKRSSGKILPLWHVRLLLCMQWVFVVLRRKFDWSQFLRKKRSKSSLWMDLRRTCCSPVLCPARIDKNSNLYQPHLRLSW